MKSPAQKERIREMLRAEAQNDPNSAWSAFKSKLKAELTSAKAPVLEITARPRRKITWSKLITAAAIAVFCVGLLSHHYNRQQVSTTPTPLNGKNNRELIKGENYVSGKNIIRIFDGGGSLTELNGSIRVVARTLRANFILREATNMQIEHPLVTVTITGTQFVFDAQATGGKIDLQEGKLQITCHLPGMSNTPIDIEAPNIWYFSQQQCEPLPGRPKNAAPAKALYRYELTSGEVFFAYQIHIDSKQHRVALLGGKEQTIAVESIARCEKAENP